MDISKLTIGQKEALAESLDKQTSLKTTAEIETLNKLREDLSEVITVGGIELFNYKDKFVKQVNIDNFGEDYKNRWIKLKETSKGLYFTASYFSNKRIYI